MKEISTLPVINIDMNEILGAFPFSGMLLDMYPFGNGHINDTYCACYQLEDGNIRRYVVQRINTTVFRNPDELMDNIVNVTAFLREDILKNGGDPERETLSIIMTTDGRPYYTDSMGLHWRASPLIENSISYDSVNDPELFYSAAVIFGRFMKRLANYPAGTLHETIPQFHDTRKRFDDFRRAVEADVCGRASGVSKEIEFVMARKGEVGILLDALNAGDLPLRVTHNDTKLNNVLFDADSGEGMCVIDLDTVMPGLCLFDYGDSIRFGASSAAEDERDLDRVFMELSLFEAFTKGYLQETAGILTGREKALLPMGAKLITLECGMRFLTDYLCGDGYFKIHRAGQNLDRARTQLKLVSDMESKWMQMEEIVRRYC